MRGRRGTVLLALAVVGAGLAPAPASALVATLYVGQSQCSDSGPGTSDQPFCTVSKAASVVQPGQSVMVGYGNYDETVTIRAKGSAGAPIKFIGQSNLDFPGGSWVGIDSNSSALSDHAFVLDGAQYVSISGFGATGGAESVLVENSAHVTVDQLSVLNPSATSPDLRVTGSSDVTVSRSAFQFGIELDPGTSGSSIVDDIVANGPVGDTRPGPAILATDAPDTRIVNDTLTPSCGRGVDLEGASAGSTIANLVINTSVGEGQSGVCGQDNPGITVAPGSVSGTTSDYNVVYTGADDPYSWDGVTYADPAGFNAATGEGGHDLADDPMLVTAPDYYTMEVPFYPAEGAPEIDSADTSAAPSTDIATLPRIDDPLAANAGTGSGAADRGAFEFQDPIALAPLSVKHAVGGGPLDVEVSTGVAAAWSQDITYTYNFQDGTPNVVTTSTTVRHDFAEAGGKDISVTANDGFADSRFDQNSATFVSLGADYTPLAPKRILDTRKAIGVPSARPIPPNSDIELTVAGVGAIPAAAGLSAVVLNVTVTQPRANGHLTVYPPSGGPVPEAANLTFSAGSTICELVTVQVQNGKVALHNASDGTVQVAADAEGYYANSGYGFKPVAAKRVLDTRAPIGVSVKAPIPSGGHLPLDLSAAIPAGAKAVAMNVTVANPKSEGTLTVYPGGTRAPNAANLVFNKGETVSNLVVVPVNHGRVEFLNGSDGTVDVAADLAGYYGDATTDATAGLLPQVPTRVFETGVNSAGPIGAHSTLQVSAYLFPSVSSLAQAPVAAVLDITATHPAAGGSLTVYADGASRPNTSNLDFSRGKAVSNLAVVGFGTDGIDMYNGSSGSTGVAVDFEGEFIPPLP